MDYLSSWRDTLARAFDIAKQAPLVNFSQRIRVAQGLTPDPTPAEKAAADARAARRDAQRMAGVDGRPQGPELPVEDLRLPDGSWPEGFAPTAQAR